MFSVTFFKDAAERVVSTFIQAFVAAAYNPLVDLNYGQAWKVGLGAGLASALKALAAAFRGDKESASLVK